MQEVKSYAASIGIKDRVSQQMIQVDQIGGRDNQSCVQPMSAPDYPGDEKWCQPMRAIVQNGLEKLYASIQSRKKL